MFLLARQVYDRQIREPTKAAAIRTFGFISCCKGDFNQKLIQ